jgi:hypothetical protein
MATEEPEEEKLVWAVTWDSGHHLELQAKLAATEAKLKMMEAQLLKARDQSVLLSELDPGGQLVTPPSKAHKNNRTTLAGAPMGAGNVT